MILEWFGDVVFESFNFWNNVGIGYFVLCEFNYIFEKVDGMIDVM